MRAVASELEEDALDEEYAEVMQLAYAATNTLSQAKAKGKGKGKDKEGKPGGNVIRSNLTIADRKARLTELKAKSPCRGGRKEFSKSSSNESSDVRTCKMCGTVTKTKKEKQVADPSTCLHTTAWWCLLDEQPQEERKARSDIALATIDFDLLRSIVSRTSEDLPVELVVPPLEQFRETVEGHFVTEPSITRGGLVGYLHEALEDHVQESTNTSWQIASSAGARSKSSRHAYVVDVRQSQTRIQH